MTLNKRSLRKWAESARLTISAEQEAAILERFGTEPDDEHEWTEQDIYEQVRKMLR